jgi:steroid delta-isomerase-like uncharacterized protein
MAEQNLVQAGRELIEAFNSGDGNRFKKYLAADVVYDEVATQRKIQGADAWVQLWEGWRRAMPDVKGTITNTVASGNTVMQEITWDGNQTGPLELPGGTFPASGKRQITRSSHVLIFEGDRVKQCRHYFDVLSLLQQLGAMPQQVRASGR